MAPQKISLLEEYRLIERSEHEVNGAWKGAHILLFFLSFVFGSFCTFCFHMLMYMFDEKCVLFPKLQSLTSLRHNVIYEFIPLDKKAADMPVDFLSTQWVEKSKCYLPTYVPLVSGIFGLVWTTMFLMCSTGSRTLTGLQRPWRILPPVFLFSVAMSVLCIHASTTTQNGLEELCLKLSEITGSPTCTYTVNVATLVYERRIRGVYQATRLTIMSAWLHTCCWILSAVLALVRIIIVVDFQLVRVNVDLIGDIDRMLEHEETHIRTVSPDRMIYSGSPNSSDSDASNDTFKVKFRSDTTKMENDTTMMCLLYYDEKALTTVQSKISLVPEERHKLSRKLIVNSTDREHMFIAEIVFDLIDNLDLPESKESSGSESSPSLVLDVARQYGQARIKSFSDHSKEMAKYNAHGRSNIVAEEGPKDGPAEAQRSRKKSNLKSVSIQTNRRRRRVAARKSIKQKVKITEPKRHNSDSSASSDKPEEKKDKESQTKKEKQD